MMDNEAIVLQQGRLPDAFNSLVEAVIAIDEVGTVISCNDATQSLFGYAADELKGNNVKMLMPDAAAKQHDGYLQTYLAARKSNISLGRDVEGKTKNNTLFPMHLSIGELAPVHGKRQFIGLCIDLTQSRKQEEQISRSQRMDALGILAGGVAHDYNNVLGIVLGFSELLKEALADEFELCQLISEIQHAAERGVKLTQKLLGFSREKKSTLSTCSLNEFLLSETHMLEKMMTVRIQLLTDLEEDCWLSALDTDDLEGAVVNMAINAMQAMKSGGLLTIRTRNKKLTALDAGMLEVPPGDYVQLSLIDSGVGMDEKTLKRIFEPFYSTKGDLGNGLGLSQVYGFVKRSKGAISVESKPGQGTHFGLFFPRHFSPLATTAGQIVDDEEIDLSGDEAILVVDDEPALCKMAKQMLVGLGYKVHIALSASQALEILDCESIDLLFSDVVMPGMDGYQLAAMVTSRYPSVKIQLASGFHGDYQVAVTSRTLHQNLIQKPYLQYDLATKFREVLDKEPMVDSPWVKKVVSNQAKVDKKLQDLTSGNTSHRQEEEKFGLNDQYFHLLLEQMPDPMFVCRIEDYQFVAVSSKACENYGYSRKELLKMKIFDIEALELREEQVHKLYDDVAVGQSLQIQSTNKRKDGSTFPAHVRFYKLDYKYAVANVSDVTLLQKANAECEHHL